MTTKPNILKSFQYAFQGIGAAFKQEPKIRLHCLAAFVVLFFCYAYNFNAFEWIVSIVCIILVLAAELFNTAIETLSDVVSTDFNDGIKRTKDIAAGAVVSIVIGVIIIWVILLYNHFITL